jgi:hypothetical protein
MKPFLILLFLYIFVTCSVANAENTLLVDLNGYAGGDPGDNFSQTYGGGGGIGVFDDSVNWNGLLIFSSQPNTIEGYYPFTGLRWADGSSASGISITLSGFNSADYYNPGGVNQIYYDYVRVSTAQSGTITISGLDVGVSYDVAGHSSNSGGTLGANWTLIGESTVGPILVGVSEPSSKQVGTVGTNSSGRIIIKIDPAPSQTYGFANGFEIRRVKPVYKECSGLYLAADLNKDCSVNFLDFAIFAETWLE